MAIDLVVNSFMQSIENPVLTAVSEAIAPIFDPLVLIVLSFIIVFYVYTKSSKAKALFFGGVMILTGGIIFVAKETFERLRPLDAQLLESSFSFPSGHATIAVVFFGLIVYLFISKKYRFSAIVTASLLTILIGFSRVYLRVHWFTDVLGGFVLGGIILTGGILVFRKIS